MKRLNKSEAIGTISRDMSRNARNGKFGNFDEISPKIKSNPANSARMAILTWSNCRIPRHSEAFPPKIAAT